MAYRIQPNSVKRQKSNRTVTRLFLCTVVFFVAVLMKITDAPGVSRTVLDAINAGDAKETLARIGMSVTDPENDITQVFASMIQSVFAPKDNVVEVDVPSDTFTTATPTVSVDEGVEPSDTAQVSIEAAVTVSLPEEIEASIPAPDVVSLEAVSIDFPYMTPVSGQLTSPFGYRDHPIDKEIKFHYGVDIGAPKGTKIYAFADGVVDSVLTGEINGNYFRISHPDGIVSMYAHCQKVVVKEGQKVKKGDVIAYVGDTGQVTAAHLHFQLYKDAKLIDPTPFLEVEV